jgi:PAS domain S-box-containing protein
MILEGRSMPRAAARSATNEIQPRIHREPLFSAPHPGHMVQFYDDDQYLVRTVSEFLASGLAAGQSLVVIATEEHRKAFAQRLEARGFDVRRTTATGRLTLLDAREMLSSFMVDASPDADRFLARIGGVVRASAEQSEHSCVCAYGEMVDLLWKDGNIAAAVRLEELWNELAATHSFSLLCAYAMGNFGRTDHGVSFAAICNQHTRVAPTERFTEADDKGRMLEVSLLQQRARALESEIEFRKNLERELREVLVERQQAEDAVRRSERELKDFLENAAEGMHWVGPTGIILWANKTEIDMLGYERDEYVGHSITEFHVDAGAIAAILDRLRCGEELREREAQLRCKDGSTKDVLINSNVLMSNGEFVHTRCFTRDITDLKRAMVERERLIERERAARKEAEEASRAKSDFLAVMSHELRTPLNAIGGHVQLIEMELHGPVTTEQRDALHRVERSQRHLLTLINDVLNLSRIESGHMEYALSDVEAVPLLADIVSMLDPIFVEHELSCALDTRQPVASEAPIVVRGDREKIHQILLNLVTNAIKFTPAGGAIALEAAPCATSPAMACLRVHDSGIGIPATKLESVFEPFVQLGARPATAHPQGVGLGLAISRDLARGMGGDLTATSIPGEGSVFTLTLPRA